jgi:hypothetical protein
MIVDVVFHPAGLEVGCPSSSTIDARATAIPSKERYKC